ncbi:arylamine N-acetyltransferase [Kitasatospora kazusensis]|uniref:Arylamine N-acetyltransferase n=1 Tax=Kitasatospora kazusensis TaxID=407974 RepID=A0ABP5KU82_9ACTN
MEESRLESYLDRIGAERPGRPDLAALRRLQRAHLLTVPFENLSIHLGEPVLLDEASLLAKLVDRRRGGFCYELNGAFAALLTALGYRVDLLAARVINGPVPGPPFDHLALRVRLDERDGPDGPGGADRTDGTGDTDTPWLVDVGFGRFSVQPLRLDLREPQTDPGGVFTVVEHGEELDVLLDGKPQYRLDPRPYALSDFVPTCWWHSTSPDSPFARATLCSRLTESGRVSLTGTRLIRSTDGEREERDLDEAAALDACRTLFGMELDRLPVARG